MSKRNEEKLTHKVFARVNERKYEELQDMLRQSRCKTLCELVRNILYHEKTVTVTYDASLDKVMEELSAMSKQLRGIGHNVNQITRKLHQQNLPAAQRELLLSLAELQQQTQQSISGLFTTIAKLSEKWLPE